MRSLILSSLAALLACLACETARAQFGEVDENGTRRGKEFVTKYEVGMIITAGGEACTDLIGTAPVPIDWPEQEVRIVQEDFDPAAKRVTYRETAGGTIKQIGREHSPGAGK